MLANNVACISGYGHIDCTTVSGWITIGIIMGFAFAAVYAERGK